MTDDAQFTEIEVFFSVQEYDIVKAMLDAEGIESFQEGKHLTAIPLYSTIMSDGIHLIVHESDRLAAEEVLGEYRCRKEAVEDRKAMVCPDCGKKEVVEIYNEIVFLILTVLSLGMLFLLNPCRYKCAHCGHKWAK